MATLVTGATGFVGSQVVEQLCELDCPVSVLVHNRAWTGDPTVNVMYSPLLEKGGVVLHCAKMPLAEFTEFVTECIEAGIHRFILLSCTEAMGSALFGDEDSICDPTSEIGMDKLQEERILTGLATGTDMSTLILRPANIYGPGAPDDNYLLQLLTLVDTGAFFFVPGSGKMKMQFIHIDDVARTLAHIIDSPGLPETTHEISIIAPITSFTATDILCLFAQLIGRRLPSMTLPVHIGRVLFMLLGFDPRVFDHMETNHTFVNSCTLFEEESDLRSYLLTYLGQLRRSGKISNSLFSFLDKLCMFALLLILVFYGLTFL